MSRSMAPAAAGTTMSVLGVDLLQEIFIHLPDPGDLLRSAAACKPFLRAVRSARFLRRFRRRHSSTFPPLLGCILLRRSHNRGSLENHPVYLLTLSAAARRVVEGGDFALSFLPHRKLRCGAPWNVLDCRNGRLMLCSPVSRELVVADPLTRHWVSLPVLPALRPIGYGLVTDYGEYSVFQAVCISRSGTSPGLRAFLLSSGELQWAEVAGLANQFDFADSRAMQANRSLYWTLQGRDRMLAFNTTTMEFSVLELPLFLREYRFDVIEKGEDDTSGLYIVTMRDFCIEIWAGVEDDNGGLVWTMVEKSVRFRRVLKANEQDVIGVVAGVLFLQDGDGLVSIDLNTMMLRRFPPRDNCPLSLIYPYTMAWPPLCLNPTEEVA
ncbi:uncharacterized protein LOC100829802 [Brachypodium distachyon]|uniref:F-box protein AT5G49610-like beta-propeller domain-containing protein n=1 Tax=Brachypodium distachyon TaxID=15368 RepID=I1HLW3_BRADI|nr:uncharacterized protein LOC100829802 [Brachypodium distachyon]XP_010231713.1 uncharacterized protein LOC100829802 [Brachypodium distachyon]KQK07533.1 hypothetical protein BRADI_2g36080v3 [Brachypodium distachyon]KQK07534.1 hypothetical protein BRADI_2g36080v3 [Brachypodium distachyon]|eukprot:XP_003568947.2 uncharacterized protein LOC100829802 [Brachypodium distachyon]